MDFYKIETKFGRKTSTVEIYPVFQVKVSKDLMVKSKEFYAFWDEEAGLWSKSLFDLIEKIDKDLDRYYEEHKESFGNFHVNILHIQDFDSGMATKFSNYIKLMPDNYKQLDCKVAFSNTKLTKKDYCSKTLPYAKEPGDMSCYEELISTLYSPEEREKFEWAIGSVIEGDSKDNQKFFVFYGAPGTGKSTVLDIIEALFSEYYKPFVSKSLGNLSNQFATEMFKDNPLVGIEQDGDLSHIEDNTVINSIVSHDKIVVNEKHKAQYAMRFNTLLFLGTNKPVKITDEKSGIKRRLVDISPTGNKVPKTRYHYLKKNILNFELGAIAEHCHEVYKILGSDYYEYYESRDMQLMTDPFMNFMEDNYELFKRQNYTFISQAYDLYKKYVEDAGLKYKLTKVEVRYRLKDYFKDYKEEERIIFNGEEKHVRSYYYGFLKGKFKRTTISYGADKLVDDQEKQENKSWLEFKEQESKFDEAMKGCPAQYATEKETPSSKWDNVTTILDDINTSELHYVKVPENHIVLDFDLKDENGNKSYERNFEAASQYPKTYAELSKSGAGIHLHYIYNGDVTKLARVIGPDIEIKVFTGKSSLRRRLTKCNNLDIAKINSGLPIKETKDNSMYNQEFIKTEKGLRNMIIRNLRKEIHPGTKPSIDFIYKILEDAYNNGVKYDVSDLYPDVAAFAAGSTHQAQYCIDLVSKMKFKSIEDEVPADEPDNDILVFYDVEVFPNLFLINWKYAGEQCKCVRMINPTPEEVAELCKYKLVGYNCRRYDNHILYARMMGATNEELFDLSQKLIAGSPNALKLGAYNLSYTDVYDFCAKKQSLKKWEIDLGIHHQELGFDWNKPVPKEKWFLVAEYCDNDVYATEAVFNANQADFFARNILADITGGTVNDTTNSLTTKLIFGDERHPQVDFLYRNLAEPVNVLRDDQEKFLKEHYPDILKEPFVEGNITSRLPFFPGYKFDHGVSTYRGIEVGEGGEVWAKHGMYGRTKTFDVSSMHPNSAGSEYLFGKYTGRFYELVRARLLIKGGKIEEASRLFDGKLTPYLKDKDKTKQLAYALKIAINSIYGLTAAKFENAFKDNRNKDNIVAKRGALFMINLLHEVQMRGGEVIHIKTDSIKVVNPTKKLEEFIIRYGKRYGYTFEIEHIFEKICLVNDAVYIAKVALDDPEWLDACEKARRDGKPEPTRWTATGTQFAVPYVFKTLFSGEELEFKDFCETKSVVSGAIYLDCNEYLENVESLEKELDIRMYNLNHEKPKKTNPEYADYSDEDLADMIAKGHNYIFVGRTGLFTPVKANANGGILYRMKDDKYYAVTGTKGYRWLESETVRANGLEGDVDETYYQTLADEAIATINEFGDYYNFISDDFVAPVYEELAS